MKPGGHLATGLTLSAVGYLVTRSPQLAVGCFAGAFLIDVDHYLDYLAFEGKWRQPSVATCLQYYFTHRYHKVVLPLHSLELLVALAGLASIWPEPILLGYLTGAFLHIVLDILVNGEHILRRPIVFYSFVYRMFLGFAADRLIERLTIPSDAGQAPGREFFTWRGAERRLHPRPK